MSKLIFRKKAHAPDCVTSPVVNWTKSNFCWGTFRFRPPNPTLGCKQKLRSAVNDRLGLEPDAE